MRKLILVVHISLDGFVAGPRGELDGFEAAEENLEFVCKLTEDADAALFGRNSYQLLQKYWPTAREHPGATHGEVAYSNWYNQAKKIIISRTMSGKHLPNTTIISDNIAAEIIKIKNQPGKNILIFGSPTASQSLMQLKLIDSYWIFINPSLFGEGIPLFPSTSNLTKLKLISTQKFNNGEIAFNYDMIA
jgi:dihydrofolate reductase